VSGGEQRVQKLFYVSVSVCFLFVSSIFPSIGKAGWGDDESITYLGSGFQELRREHAAVVKILFEKTTGPSSYSVAQATPDTHQPIAANYNLVFRIGEFGGDVNRDALFIANGLAKLATVVGARDMDIAYDEMDLRIASDQKAPYVSSVLRLGTEAAAEEVQFEHYKNGGTRGGNQRQASGVNHRNLPAVDPGSAWRQAPNPMRFFNFGPSSLHESGALFGNYERDGVLKAFTTPDQAYRDPPRRPSPQETAVRTHLVVHPRSQGVTEAKVTKDAHGNISIDLKVGADWGKSWAVDHLRLRNAFIDAYHLGALVFDVNSKDLAEKSGVSDAYAHTVLSNAAGEADSDISRLRESEMRKRDGFPEFFSEFISPSKKAVDIEMPAFSASTPVLFFDAAKEAPKPRPGPPRRRSFGISAQRMNNETGEMEEIDPMTLALERIARSRQDPNVIDAECSKGLSNLAGPQQPPGLPNPPSK
jgi:hypothetical protein